MSGDYGNVFDAGAMMRLRAQLSSSPDRDTIREVAQQFESLFVQTMLKSMRAATPGDSLLGGHGEDQYRKMFDQQMSLQISRGPGLGLAPMIERQMLQDQGLIAAPPELDTGLERYAQRLPTRTQAAVESTTDVEPAPEAAIPRRTAAPVGHKAPIFREPEEFVASVRDAAKRIADRLGVPAQALVAQAALETGWGQHIISTGDGQSSHNLFGIKAHRDWDGDTVRVPTLEYREGVPTREMASFRAYRSVEESFEDYANFLLSNPRYEAALRAGRDPEAYVQALQDAGYATDPQYAEKLSRIMNSDRLTAMRE